ncbi:amino acid ABC transporter permease [Paracoccus aminophilus]|uniref:Glutamate/glutamine/aspartate/asparagine transport system, permease protein n=1 Tax=Paracoccus aminophilus JCM 7686 TaxID=1367847 RepID=S5XRZ0_PARAH|nr:amino acid ABC transporter permease [Paracoccus aminophilus]AGT10209.1 glutamate/glutamine/aspartate/asparagine transport system, permease protein [Paracoccus aminophilus JCM 7686]
MTESRTAPQTPPLPFVRNEMIAPAAPPRGDSGILHWMRENLFRGPLNIALTLCGLAAIWLLIAKFGPWLSHAVWHADSLRECRQIITERYGEGATGACFAVIKHRWNQFLFGFYPRAEYWRPTLAFGLLFFAIAPVLFSDSLRGRRSVLALASVLTFMACQILGASGTHLLVAALGMVLWVALIEYRPRWSLIATLVYPFLGVWLLWGGSVWFPVLALAGFVLGYAVSRVLARLGMIGLAIGVVAALLFWGFAYHPLGSALGTALPLSLPRVPSTQFGGFVLSITIGVAGIAMSLPAGIILALARQSHLPVVRMLAVMFIEFIRGVPLIGMLFVASLLLNYFLPPKVQFDIILRVIVMVTIFASAYMAEVIRGGLAALPKGQYEAADALGLDYWKAQRLIILPQALKVSIPSIVSTFIGMFKDTTLVTFVGLYDPLKAMSDSVRASFEWKGTYWEPYLFAGAIFFILCFGMSRYSLYLERKLKRDQR